MKLKRLGVISLTVAAALMTAVAIHAKIIDCKVVSVQKDTVVLDCGGKAANLTAGDRVKVRSSGVRRVPLMGC